MESTGKIARLCGISRTMAGCYISVPFSTDGVPFDDWLASVILDPPVPVSPDIQIPQQGMGIVEIKGVTHLVDRIGSNSTYINVADVIEEWRAGGVSRRIPITFPFEKLSSQSRLLLVHDKAWIENAVDYRKWECKFHHKPEHASLPLHEDFQMCAGFWYEDIVGGIGIETSSDNRKVLRKLPAIEYTGRKRPESIKPIYAQAFFASIPCFRIEIVKDKNHGEHLKSYEKAKKANVSVVITNE